MGCEIGNSEMTTLRKTFTLGNLSLRVFKEVIFISLCTFSEGRYMG